MAREPRKVQDWPLVVFFANKTFNVTGQVMISKLESVRLTVTVMVMVNLFSTPLLWSQSVGLVS